MGVDYGICPVRMNDNGEIEYILRTGLPVLSLRNHQYLTLFSDNLGKIEKLAHKKLDIGFYEKADRSSYGDESNKNSVYDPKEVKSTIILFLKIIKENHSLFPHYYWLGFKKKSGMSNGATIFIGDHKVYIVGGWDKCYYMLKNRKVDLTKGKSIVLGYRHFYEKIDDIWVDRKGEKVTVIIKKVSLYRYFKPDLTRIIAICNYAIKHKFKVHGYTS